MRSGNSVGDRLATVDLICLVMDTWLRPLDFTLLLHLRELPNCAVLRRAAMSACHRYPSTGSCVRGKVWQPLQEPPQVVMPRETLCRNDEARILREFVGAPLRPAQEPPVRQLLLERSGGGATLATRFHHAAGDLLSCSMWVGHQLRVVFGNEEMTRVRRSFHEIVFKTHPSPRRRSPFAFQGPCHPLWCRGHEPSRQRRWQTLEIESLLSRRCSKTANGFTYNDLLLTCALEALIQWNRLHGDRSRNVGLWLPLDIRKRPFSGFGNGISRIRIYASYSEKLSFIQKCQHVRRQIDWSRQHGLWAVPKKHFLTRIPSWMGFPLLRVYLNRPWLDVGSSVFSHLERWRPEDETVLARTTGMEIVGQLHSGYCVALNALTHANRTWLTFTYDPALLETEDVATMLQLFRNQLDQAGKELH